jgi:hypothetical protein
MEHGGHYLGQDHEGGGDNEIANMSNVHTRAISLVHFIIAIVRIMHGQFVEISSDVI